MARFLIILGLILLVAGLLWPYIGKLGLGRLPGDIVYHRGHTTFYFPIVTSLVLSVLLSLAL
jgi:multisubunit Na+/H+ antiporter MnhG subunit